MARRDGARGDGGEGGPPPSGREGQVKQDDEEGGVPQG
jgi:hypothetical protein